MQYVAAKTADEAVALLVGQSGMARVLAGGTDLLVQLKSGMVEPDLVVDIKRIPGMKDITAEAGGFRIGAAVSGAELGEHAGVCAMWPGVV
ncbi:MAG: FAD binding domain-containing protein, partial [Rhodobacteraceae bacterium]|nr:FAD binding domain-containing protein [Paracoccaceae bacterium]